MIFYILLTYGAKPTGPLRDHRPAKTQIAFFQNCGDRYPDAKKGYIVDRARRVKNMASLPKLKNVLSACQRAEAGLVFIADLAQIFRLTPLSLRPKLYSELSDFGPQIYSIMHGKKLSDFSNGQVSGLVMHAEKQKPVVKQRRNQDTENVRESSMATRHQRSVEIARKIRELRCEMIEADGRATHQMVADRANALGMRTSTDMEWSRQTVGSALEVPTGTD